MPLSKILSRVQAPRRTTKQSLALAAVFAVEVLIAGIALYCGYKFFGANGFYWALVSAILVLQPGLEQSLTTAMVRIAANIVGASIGLIIGTYLSIDVPQIFLAIVVVVFICEIFRLDLGLRSACVSVIIVMTNASTGEIKITTSTLERCIAVIVGCLTAVLLQLLLERLLARLKLLPNLPDPPAPTPLKPAQKSIEPD
jgi:uncharacterized membrane protein YgaE (UPF0421/DUF939 family)